MINHEFAGCILLEPGQHSAPTSGDQLTFTFQSFASLEHVLGEELETVHYIYVFSDL